jgi:polar amino acid transport system substrate-binding protein
MFLAAIASCAPADRGAANALRDVQARGVLSYASDKEGGGPYAYPDPTDPSREIGFEVDLMNAIGRDLGVRSELAQGQWDTLLNNLATGRSDVVVNGYEWTADRARDFLATRPYYVYQLQLMVPIGSSLRSWDDLKSKRPDGRKWRLGVLGGSAPEPFARREAPDTVEVVSFTGATDAMLSTLNGQLDATLQDLPAARFYRHQYPNLALVGTPVSKGYYVMYLRRGDESLRDAIDAAIVRLQGSGAIRSINIRYDIQTDAQDELATWTPDLLKTLEGATGQESRRGLELVRGYLPILLAAAGMTIFLSITSMPLAIGIGLAVALGRLYGPKPLRWVLGAYVELLRGTPLMLQLFVLFYLLRWPALVAGIAGLAINYSAYEAEIYRAGLQAIPPGQMEAGLALGMSKRLALRRIVVPQAVRIVIPPVTNDFIALFKDTSVCSVITLVELSKQYQILANSTGGVLEFALATSVLYLLMSLPLSWFSRWSEAKMGAEMAKGGALA